MARQLTAVKMTVLAKPVTEFTDLSGNKRQMNSKAASDGCFSPLFEGLSPLLLSKNKKVI